MNALTDAMQDKKNPKHREGWLPTVLFSVVFATSLRVLSKAFLMQSALNTVVCFVRKLAVLSR